MTLFLYSKKINHCSLKTVRIPVICSDELRNVIFCLVQDMTEKGRETERDRERHRETERDRETEKERGRERETASEIKRDKKTNLKKFFV